MHVEQPANHNAPMYVSRIIQRQSRPTWRNLNVNGTFMLRTNGREKTQAYQLVVSEYTPTHAPALFELLHMKSMGIGSLFISSTALRALRTSNKPGPRGRLTLGLHHQPSPSTQQSISTQTITITITITRSEGFGQRVNDNDTVRHSCGSCTTVGSGGLRAISRFQIFRSTAVHLIVRVI